MPSLCQGKKNILKGSLSKFFFLLEIIISGWNKGSWCRKCLGGGVRGVTYPQNHAKKDFCLPQSRVKWVEMTNVTCQITRKRVLRVSVWENQSLYDIDDGVTSQNRLIFQYVVEGSELSMSWNFQLNPTSFWITVLVTKSNFFENIFFNDFTLFPEKLVFLFRH